MKLLAAGCSFVYGNELADFNENGRPSRHTFPALLAQDLNLRYQCVAIPGTGSDSHVRTVVENFDHDTDFVVVAWSYADRFEFHYNQVGWLPLIECQEKTRSDFNELVKHFHTVKSSEYTWLNYIKNIWFLQTWLQAKKVNYVFCAIDPFFVKDICQNQMYKKLYEELDWSHWYFWKLAHWYPSIATMSQQPETENEYLKQLHGHVGFTRWVSAKSKTDPRFISGPGGHPLEHAHYATFLEIKQQLGIQLTP